jgi:hypothetical protein
MIAIPIQAPIAPRPIIKPQASATNERSVITIPSKLKLNQKIKSKNQKPKYSNH